MLDGVTFNPFTYQHRVHVRECPVFPYMDGMPTGTTAPWCDQQKYQIIAAGMADGLFGALNRSRDPGSFGT